MNKRPDTNRIAFKAARTLLGAAHDFKVLVEGRDAAITVRGPVAGKWPQGFDDINEAADGAWPQGVELHCKWEGGEALLRVSAVQARSDSNRWIAFHVALLSGAEAPQALVWSAIWPGESKDGDSLPIGVFASLFRRQNEVAAPNAGPMRAAFERAGFEPVEGTKSDFILFHLKVPSGELTPGPRECFERLVRAALIKLPFIVRGAHPGVRGQMLFEPEGITAAAPVTSPVSDEEEQERFASAWPLPGGVRNYKATFDAILDWLSEAPRSRADLYDHLGKVYDANGRTSVLGYERVFITNGCVEIVGDRLVPTDRAKEYLKTKSADELFEMLRESTTGFFELLVIIETLGRAKVDETNQLLRSLLDTDWGSVNQAAFRRNWLLSLGFTVRSRFGDELTQAGRDAIERHEEEAERLRPEIQKLVEQLRMEGVFESVPPEAPLDEVTSDLEAPEGWLSETVDLTPEQLRKQLKDLRFPDHVLAQVCAAISCGKHLLLVGPPGTGKTELAKVIADAARDEGYCAGLFPATASADWTTFDTIGGYGLEKDSSLRFRPGVLPRSIEAWKWLLIDELNRADVDRAFGELLTVLAGGTTMTPFENEKGIVSIGRQEAATFHVPGSFRVLATMNTWDKTSLFRLSFAVQRRFAVVQLDPPESSVFLELLDADATGASVDPPLADSAKGALRALFGRDGVSKFRDVGPAIARDMVRYMRKRGEPPRALPEAITMFLLPQLEGLDTDSAKACLSLLSDSCAGLGDDNAIRSLERSFAAVFPGIV